MADSLTDLGQRILLLHASAVSVDNGAAIFLGPSGTGKSTISQLFGKHARVLADDCLFIVSLSNTHYSIARVDRHSFDIGRPTLEELQNLTRSRQLRVIFRLHQAANPRVQRIDELTTCRYLTDAFFEVRRHEDYNLQQRRLAFAQLAAVARRFPGYELYFDRSQRTVELVNEAMDRS